MLGIGLPGLEIQIGANGWPFVLTFPTKDVHLGGVRRAVGDWLDEQTISLEARSALVLAAHEAVANAVEHGQAGHTVRIRGRVDDGIVTIEVSDEGGWQQATLDNEERGRGIMLIAGLMDEFELSSNGPGTTLRMVRAVMPLST